LLTAVPLLRVFLVRSPVAYHLAGSRWGTATLKVLRRPGHPRRSRSQTCIRLARAVRAVFERGPASSPAGHLIGAGHTSVTRPQQGRRVSVADPHGQRGTAPAHHGQRRHSACRPLAYRRSAERRGGTRAWAAPGRTPATVHAFFDALGAERATMLTHVSLTSSRSRRWGPAHHLSLHHAPRLSHRFVSSAVSARLPATRARRARRDDRRDDHSR